MSTLNIAITNAWTKLADASATELLVSWADPVTVELATTEADAAPTVVGHRLTRDDAVSRGVLGSGYVWARLIGKVPAGANLVVSK